MKYVIFIPDGSSDYPVDELDGKTPLMVADTPNIDKLAKNGFGGFTNNVPEQYTPGSDVANMSIFGYNPADFYTGRGPLEAGSVGIDTNPTDIIFRCNTITEKDDMMEDFNAGHITSEEAAVLMDALNNKGITADSGEVVVQIVDDIKNEPTKINNKNITIDF